MVSTNYPIIATGVTDSGYHIGMWSSVLRQDSTDIGTLTGLYGVDVQYGHYTGTATARTTTNAYGVVVNPYYMNGTITNMYDLYLAAGNAGGTVTKHYGVYQASASADNYFAGQVGIGLATPVYQVDISATSTARMINTRSYTSALQYHHVFQNNSGVDSGSIGVTGSTTSFNTSSDRRLKENIVDSRYGLLDLMKIKVHDFDFISDPSHTQVNGFIAQELDKVYPIAVTRNGDDGMTKLASGTMPWSVDYGRLSPLLVKSVQELKAANDNLVNETATLKAQLKATNDNYSALRHEIEEMKRHVAH